MRALRQRRITGKSLRRRRLRARKPPGDGAAGRRTRSTRPNPVLAFLRDGMVGLWRNQVLLVEIITLAVMAALIFGVPLFPASSLTIVAGFVVLYWLSLLVIWRLKLWGWWIGRLSKGEWPALGNMRTLDRVALGDKADEGDWGHGP